MDGIPWGGHTVRRVPRPWKKKACRQLSEEEEPGEETGKEQRDSVRTGQRSAGKGRRDLQRGNDQQFSLG